MDWAGKVAIVTGASSGIGAAVAREFCTRGARVALVARSVEKLATLADELNRTAQSAVAVAFPLDVTRRDLLGALPVAVKAHFGRLDFLVNNAGANQRGPLSERSAEELVAILETNLVAPVLLSHAALGLLEPGGMIFNVASLAGKVPVPHEAVYSGSKAGMRAFARALDLELADARRGVRVLTVCPGPVDTGFLGEDLTHVPDLVFSQPMSSAEGVARALVALAEGGKQERDIPALSGKLATLSYLSPRLFALLRPAFARLGARKKATFIARRRIAQQM
jgi:short-subunit dehydrogenase